MTNIAQITHERKTLLLVDAPETPEDRAALEQLAGLLETITPAELVSLFELGREYLEVRARYSHQRSLDG